MSYEFEIYSEIPSKKNLLKRSKNGGMFYDEKTKDKLNDIELELINQKRKYKGLLPLKGEIQASILMQGADRTDFNNSISTLLDCLQESDVIENDRAVKHFVDCHKKKSPFTYCKIILSVL